jgi:hypothetical protein
MIKKIIFIVEQFFSDRDYIRFGIADLQRNGFELLVLDVTPLVNPHTFAVTGASASPCFHGHHLMFNYKELNQELSSNCHNSFIIPFVPYRYETWAIFRAISKFKLPYAVLSMAVPYSEVDIINVTATKSLSFFDRLSNLVFKLRYQHLIRYFFNKVPNYLLGLKFADYVFLAGAKSSTNLKVIGKQTEPVWIHTFDYDNYLDSKCLQTSTKNSYAVFLDQNLPFHPDFINEGKDNPFEPQLYYSELGKVFNAIEKLSNVKVVIAAHPRADLNLISSYFNGRGVVTGDTVNLVRDATFCITHWSNSINFAVLYKKPIIFLTNSIIKQSHHQRMLDSYSSPLDRAPIDMSADIDLDRHSLDIISSVAYDRYKHNFIKTDNSPELKFWEIVSSILSNRLLDN